VRCHVPYSRWGRSGARAGRPRYDNLLKVKFEMLFEVAATHQPRRTSRARHPLILHLDSDPVQASGAPVCPGLHKSGTLLPALATSCLWRHMPCVHTTASYYNYCLPVFSQSPQKLWSPLINQPITNTVIEIDAPCFDLHPVLHPSARAVVPLSRPVGKSRRSCTASALTSPQRAYAS